MDTISNAPRHLRLYGVALALAALLIALLAVTMTPGPTQADNDDEYDDPVPCSEESIPGPNTAEAIGTGDYAVFEAFWDYEVSHLSNNFCPPGITETTEQDDEGEDVTVYTRDNADIDIRETAFSIHESSKVTVIHSYHPDGNPSTVTGDTIDLVDYPFLSSVVSAVEQNSTGDTVFANNSLYWVRLDEPWTTTADETSDLRMGLSTLLMEEADWYRDDDDDATTKEKPVTFRFDAVHVLHDDQTLPEAHVLGAHFFAFDPRTTDTPMHWPEWSNVTTANASEIEMNTGEYRPLQFIFTKPGVYRVQVNVEGHVRGITDPAPDGGYPNGWHELTTDESITGPAQWYTFHVGVENDPSVEITAADETPNDDETTVTGDTVSFTVTADNGGPNGVQNAVVQVRLPEGLEYQAGSSSVSGVNYECGVISWDLGSMNASSSNTLTFTADVGANAAGRLAATAEIRSLDPQDLDTDTENNLSSATVLLNSSQVRSPLFGGVVARSIPEHASSGAHAGDPVAASNPDARKLHYSLSGRCNDWFEVHSNGQITLDSGVSLDYREQWAFPLTLHVSDHLDSSGAADTATDDSVSVLVEVIDTEDTAVHPTVTFSLSNPNHGDQPNLDLGHPVVGYTVTINTHLHDLPPGATPVYDWHEEGAYNYGWANRIHTSHYPAQGLSAGHTTYKVHIKWDGGGVTAKHTVQWYNPDSNYPGP